MIIHTFNGTGWRKWFWYLFFEIITIRGFFPIDISGATFFGFKMEQEELKHFVLARFIYDSLTKKYELKII
jgi:hypothetical protein